MRFKMSEPNCLDYLRVLVSFGLGRCSRRRALTSADRISVAGGREEATKPCSVCCANFLPLIIPTFPL